MRVLITDTLARNHRPAKDREDIFDSQIPGLRLRISKKSGVRSWDFRYKSPLTAALVSLKIGSYPATSVGGARERALAAFRMSRQAETRAKRSRLWTKLGSPWRN